MKFATKLIGKIRYSIFNFHAALSALTTNLEPIDENSLLKFARNTHSQVGQDGIIGEITKRLGLEKGRFVEFGAWDGVYLSNARLLAESGWDGIFIEGSTEKFHELCKNYPNDNIIKINSLVCPSSEFPYLANGETLIQILKHRLSNSEIEEIDLVCIDIDGADLEVALSIGFKPKIIILEGGSLLRPSIDAAYPNAYNNAQHPLSFIIKKMEYFGYKAVCFNQDLFVVRKDLSDRVISGGLEYSAEHLYRESMNFRGKKFLSWLILQRLLNPDLKQFEKKMTGKFVANPLRT